MGKMAGLEKVESCDIKQSIEPLQSLVGILSSESKGLYFIFTNRAVKCIILNVASATDRKRGIHEIKG